MKKLIQSFSALKLRQEVAKLQEENRRLKVELDLDDLTGLYNSRSLRVRLRQTLTDRMEKGEGPALLFLDLDRFKWINETHGHRAGGHLLKQVGKLIHQVIREGDVAFRYGGDEFVVLVSGGKEGAWAAGERLRRAVEEHSFRVQGLQGLCEVRLTVSVGFHVLTPGDSTETILDEADRAMYEAKKSSRNKVVSSAA